MTRDKKPREIWLTENELCEICDHEPNSFNSVYNDHIRFIEHSHHTKLIEEKDALANSAIDKLVRKHVKLMKSYQRIDELEKQVSNLSLNSIHTCHSECQRLPCAQARRIERIEKALNKVSEIWKRYLIDVETEYPSYMSPEARDVYTKELAELLKEG